MSLLVAPYVFFSIIVNKQFRWTFVDIMALVTFVWPFLAYFLTDGLWTTFENGGVLFLEIAIPYFLARAAIVDYRDIKQLSNRLLFCIVILVILSFPESLTGKYFVHDVSGAITGNPFFYSVSRRLGLWRAMGPTDHPIVLGTICASGVLIAATLALREQRYIMAFIACLIGTFISLSSGPLLAAVAQFGLISWSRMFAGFKHRWWLLILLILLFYILVDIYSNRDPFRVMFSYLLFNTGTGYARYYMWINSIYLINLSPFSMLFGYGNSLDFFKLLEDPYWAYTMARTIDSFWLVQLLHFGWPILLFNSIFIIALFNQVWKRYRRSDEVKEKRLLEAWMIAGLALTLIAFTVDFWGQVAGFYYIILAAVFSFSTKTRRNQNTKNVLG